MEATQNLYSAFGVMAVLMAQTSRCICYYVVLSDKSDVLGIFVNGVSCLNLQKVTGLV